MAQPDWLKIDDISRLWNEETGLDASSLQTDLESWFAEFTRESSIARQLLPDAPFDTIVANRLLGMLGARYLERRTFELYCEERGHPKPRFWSVGPDAERAPADLAGARSRHQANEATARAESRGRARPAQLEAARQRRAASGAQDLANRRSSSATQTSRRRGTGRRRAVLAAGMAVLLVALLAWGTETLLRRAGNEPIPQASETALAPSDPAPAGGSGHTLELGSGQAVATEDKAAETEDEAARLREENALLMDQLAKARAAVESLREARQQADLTGETTPQDPGPAATASSGQLAVLEAELVSARRQIADLKQVLEEAARQRETTVVQPPEAPRTFARTDPASAGDQADPERVESIDYGAEIAEVLTGAELPSDPVTTQTVALFDVVSADDLLFQPGHYADRQVVVTGSVVWLLRRYWLRSDSGQESMMIDVDGLQPNKRSDLEDAVVNIETLAQVRARITGTIEKRGSGSYRLAASELMLLE